MAGVPTGFQRPPKRAAPSPESGRCAQRGTKARHSSTVDPASGIDAGADSLQIGKHLVGLAFADEVVGGLAGPTGDRLMLEPDRGALLVAGHLASHGQYPHH